METTQAETTNSNASSKGCVLKFIAVCGGLVTITTGLITLAGWWERRSQLTVEISSAPFVLPAFASAEHEKLEAAIKNRKEIEQALDVPAWKKEDRELAARTIANWLRGIMQSEAKRPIFDPRTVVFAEVKNTGSSTCESVSLTLHDATAVRIEREGGKIESLDISGIVDLGDLKPQDTVKITAWTHGLPPNDDEVKLVYRNGVGSIVLMKPVSPLWVGVSEDWPCVLFVMLVLMFFSVLIVVGKRGQLKESKAQPPEPLKTND
jgi:hypothetical protein